MAGSIEGVTLCAVEEKSDLPLLFRIYAASRDREMDLLVHWSDTEKNTFLRDQFQLQHNHYRAYYPDARFDLILDQGVPVGRLYVAELKDELRLMDIELLPEYRGRGIGSALMRRLLGRAAESGSLVSLHVEDNNPAKDLYHRLGFHVVEDVGVYKLMHWTPTGPDK